MNRAVHGGNLFAAAAGRGWDWREVIDFSASINPLGPSPLVRPAICEAIERIVHYPEREPAGLRRQLARKWNVAEEQVILGNGATELLHFFARVWRSRQVTLAVPVFSEFHRAYPNARLTVADRMDDWPTDQLLVITQPNNPTGATYPFLRLRTWLRDTAGPVMVDESFLDFSGVESVASLIAERPGLFVLRSLTKFHALPGLRIGALLGAVPAMDRMRAMREPWQVNVLAEAAALAALADDEHQRRTVEFVRQERAWLTERLAEVPGVRPETSSANYVFARLAGSSEGLCRFLLDRKILIRDCAGWPGVDGAAVRVAVRTREDNERLLAAWRGYSCGS